jgi:Ca-activated chloride channel family protein
MNPDDPKFTAHILGELEDLTPAERAEIEALLASDPTAAAEAKETQALAARLRAELPGEEAAPLHETQRAAVLHATQPETKVVTVSRWRRVLVPLALAASVVLGTMAYFWSDLRPATPAAAPDLLVMAAKEPTPFTDPVAVTVPLDHRLEGRTLASANGPSAPLLQPVAGAAVDAVSTSTLARNDPAEKPVAQLSTAGNGSLAMGGTVSGNASTPASASPIAAASPATPNFSMAQSVPMPAELRTKSRALASTNTYSGTTTVSGGITLSSGIAGKNEGALKSDGSRIALLEKDSDLGRLAPGTVADSNFAPRPDAPTAEAFDALADYAFLTVAAQPLSTFSIDVDTASYSIVRRFLNNQQLPPKGAVRIEELLNYFPYDYPQPQGDAPFSAAMEVTSCPWAPEHRLVRIGLKGREIAKDQRPASNLVFLIDVSGSMQPDNKLPLLKQSLALLIDQLGAEDQVAMVVYAGKSGTVLAPTHDKAKMRAALQQLEAGGSTNGASGLQIAYQLAEKSFIKGGTNRVILATDGDWNVGITNQTELIDLIKRKAQSGVFLTVLGVGMDNLQDTMLVKLADSGNGNYAYLDTLLEARKVLVEQLSGTLVTIAKDVKIQVEFNPAQVGAYRLIGYEKRVLAKEDFNDDKKDAGEIGAGHTVTALYEIVPSGEALAALPKPVDALKYQPAGGGSQKSEVGSQEGPPARAEQSAINNQPSAISPELLTLKLRYKAPDGDVSKLLEFPLTDTGAEWAKSSPDFRFAAAVAGYGMLLRDSPHKGQATWGSVAEWAQEGRGPDTTGYRAEFLALLEKAKALSR